MEGAVVFAGCGGTYDVRARQWSPELGVFLSVDEFRYHSKRTTLWGWPGQNPMRFRDPRGRNAAIIEYHRGDRGTGLAHLLVDGANGKPSRATLDEKC